MKGSRLVSWGFICLFLAIFSPEAGALTLNLPVSPTNSTTQLLSGTTGEGETAVTVVVNGVAPGGSAIITENSWSYTVEGLGNGSNSITVTAADATGNIIQTADATIIVDTVAPETEIVSQPEGVSPQRSGTFAFTSAEEGVTFQCSMDGTPFTSCASPLGYDFSTQLDGSHTFSVRATDAAGNTDPTPAVFTWSIDTVPPASPSVTGQGLTNNATPTWSWIPQGGGSGNYRYSLDSSDFTGSATETAATVFAPASALGDGEHILYVQERDVAGNWSASGSFAITVDTAAPTLASAAYVDSTHVDVTFSEAVTGADSAARYTIDSGLTITGIAFQGGTTYRVTTGLQTIGVQYTITVGNISDLAGNSISSSSHTAVFIRSADSNRAPGIPVLNSPASGSEVQGASATTPTLTVNASTDPDGDPVTFIFEISPTSGFENTVASAPITANGGTASWVVTPPLMDNATYHWRALASDGYLNSNHMAASTFFVNTANDLPTDPQVSSPANATEITTLTPPLSVTNASDLDRDVVVYSFQVAADASFATIVREVSGVAQGSGGTTSWTVSPALSDNTFYYWRSRARDEHGATSNWVAAGFFVNTINDAPTAPTLNGPARGSEVTTLAPALVVNNASDLDRFNETLGYVFEIDTVNTFDSPNKRTSPVIAEGAGSTTWVPPDLLDNTMWYWRAKANDGKADGSLMATAGFFVNRYNDAPSTPAVDNPSNNGEVPSLTPQLSVFNATDPDNDRLTYEFAVYTDINLRAADLVANGSDQNSTVWTVTPPLSDNTRYYWVARARDEHGANSRWSVPSSFVVKYNGQDNQPPTITVTAPAAEPPTNGTSYTVRWNAADPDSAASITLYYEPGNSGNAGARTRIVTGISKDSPGSYTWDTSALPDGTYYIFATIEDGRSVGSAYSPGPLIIDRTPPSAVITGVPPAITNQTGASLTVGGSEVVNYRYSMDSAPFSEEMSPTIPIALTGLADGVHTVSVTGRDSVGNWQRSATTVSWTVDTIPPVAAITGAPSGPTNSSPASLTVGGNGVVSYRYSINGGDYSNAVSITDPLPLTFTEPGDYKIAVIGGDSAGNWQAPENATVAAWTLDLTPPTAAIVAGAPPQSTNQTSIALTVGGADVAAYSFALDAPDGDAGSAEFPVSAPITRTELTEGAHTLAVAGRDAAGNWQPAANATLLRWTVDTTPPKLEPSTLPDGASTNNETLNVAGKVTDLNGIMSLSASVSSAAGGSSADLAVDAVTGAFNQSLHLYEGPNLLTLTAVDSAGNETVKKRTIILDTRGPGIFIDTPSDNSITNKQSITVSGTLDKVCRVAFKINSGTIQELVDVDKFSFTGDLAVGINTIEITATDSVGNNSTAKRTVTYDDAKPNLAISMPAQDLRTDNRDLVVRGTVDDPISSVAVTMLVSENDDGHFGENANVYHLDLIDGKFEQRISFTGFKVYHIKAIAVDLAGNESVVQRNVVYSTPANGDVNGDGLVRIDDALDALWISAGLKKQTDTALFYGDVAPMENGVSVPDGRIGVGDAIIILKAYVGLIELGK